MIPDKREGGSVAGEPPPEPKLKSTQLISLAESLAHHHGLLSQARADLSSRTGVR